MEVLVGLMHTICALPAFCSHTGSVLSWCLLSIPYPRGVPLDPSVCEKLASTTPDACAAYCSGHRLKIHIPKEGATIALAPSGVRAPQRPMPAMGGRPAQAGEPYGLEAYAWTREHFNQREVGIKGRFLDIGPLCVDILCWQSVFGWLFGACSVTDVARWLRLPISMHQTANQRHMPTIVWSSSAEQCWLACVGQQPQPEDFQPRGLHHISIAWT